MQVLTDPPPPAPLPLRWSQRAAMLLDQWPCCLHHRHRRCCPCPAPTGSILVLCSVGTAGTGSVPVLFQPPRVDAALPLRRGFQPMNGFLQRLHRASFFSPSSQADIRGGSPGSRPGSLFIYPPGRNGRIGCCFNTLKSQISRQCPVAETAETAAGKSQRSAAFSCDARAKTSSLATASSLMLRICLSSDLFAYFAISSRILNTPLAASSVLSGHLLQWSD